MWDSGSRVLRRPGRGPASGLPGPHHGKTTMGRRGHRSQHLHASTSGCSYRRRPVTARNSYGSIPESTGRQGLFYEASTLGNFCAFFLLMAAVAYFEPEARRMIPRRWIAVGAVVLLSALLASYSRASLANVAGSARVGRRVAAMAPLTAASRPRRNTHRDCAGAPVCSARIRSRLLGPMAFSCPIWSAGLIGSYRAASQLGRP